MEHGIPALRGGGYLHAAARGESFQHGPCRGEGALFIVGIDEDAAFFRASGGGQKAVEGESIPHALPFRTDEGRAPFAEVAGGNAPVRPLPGTPGGEGFRRLGGRAHAVAAQRNHLDEARIGRGRVGGGGGGGNTEKNGRQSGGKKQAAHDHLLFLYGKKYGMRRRVGQGFLRLLQTA